MEEQETLRLYEETNQFNLFMKGTVLSTIFHNPDNLFSVVRILISETNTSWEEQEIIVTGFFPKLHEQELYVFYGKMQEHIKFGQQFKADKFHKELPKSKQSIIQYLSSELFKGIGKKTAQSIVETLGDDTINKILTNPDSLDNVPKLTKKAADSLIMTLKESQGLEHIMVGLNEYGFGPQLSIRVFQAYKEKTLTILENHPYKLMEDIKGIGFQRADELGKQLGISGNHPERLRAALLFILDHISIKRGDVYIEKEDLLREAQKLLEESASIQIALEDIQKELLQLVDKEKLISENTRIYMPSLYFAENGFAQHVKRLMKQTTYRELFPISEFLLSVGRLEERLEITYDKSQKEALKKALMSPMLCLIGGPGTGKTTVIQGIVELYSELHGISLDPDDYKEGESFPILLAAPTGRAAKRMSESTGLPAMTIHRLLGMNGQEQLEGGNERTINGELLIIDEMSMVDIWLINQLFRALPKKIQVILVGDQDQLPSVGPGQVLKDILSAAIIPTVELTDIYRQKDGSSITGLAHAIKRGYLPDGFTQNSKECSFFHCTTNQIPNVVEQVVKNAKTKGFRAKDIQVLAPMYRGPAGINTLNRQLQEVFNANEFGKQKEVQFGDIKYRIKDKVLQLVNQPEKNVFNGDIGEIVSIFHASENIEKQDTIVVRFDQTEVTYMRQDFHQLTHAYCCSIHKAQGSEFPIVIMPVLRSYYRMLRRDLLYTGVTRSKQFLILCGEVEAFQNGVQRVNEASRNTTLQARLTSSDENLPIEDHFKILTLKNIDRIDPMIGMEGITPYQFLN